MIGLVEDRRVEVAALPGARCGAAGRVRIRDGRRLRPRGERPRLRGLFPGARSPGFFRRYFGLEEDLEALFGREVDLAMEGALEKSRRFAANVEASRVPLYGA